MRKELGLCCALLLCEERQAPVNNNNAKRRVEQARHGRARTSR